MDARLLFPNLYLSAAHFAQDGTLTIARVSVEDLKTANSTERKPVLYFHETHAKALQNGDASKEKRLVLNKTNAKAIAGLYGWETNEWAGKRITLYATQCQAFGETVDCIRVRPIAPASPEPPAQTVQLGVAAATATALPTDMGAPDERDTGPQTPEEVELDALFESGGH